MNIKLVIFSLVISVTSNCFSQKFDRNIVLINAENLSRGDVGRMISLVNKRHAPKVVAVDLVFIGEDMGDDKLATALSQTKKLVMAVRLSDHGNGVMNLVGGNPMFYPHQSKLGFLNLIFEDDLLNTVKRFTILPDSKFDEIPTLHLAVQTAMEFDSLQTRKFVDNNSNTVEIDYKNRNRCYVVLSGEEILKESIKADISDKIVLIGSFNPEKKYSTPLTKKGTNARVQMNELEILANIISQILEYKNN